MNSISDGISGTDFNKADLSEEFKTTLGRNMLARAENMTHTADRERANTLASIVRYYDLDQNEVNSISRQLADTPRTDLKNYQTVAGRAKFLRTVEEITMIPLLKSSTKQVANIVGDEWQNCTPETKELLAGWFNGQVLTSSLVIDAINQFSHTTKLRLVAAGMEGWTLTKFNAISAGLTTKEFFVEDARKILRDKIEESQWALLSAERMSADEIEEVVKSLDWTDIQDTRLSAAQTLTILEDRITPFIFESKVEEFVDHLQRDFVASAPESAAIYAAQSSGKIRNISAAQEQREKYEKAPKFDTNTISQIKQNYIDTGATIIGADQLLSPEFASGSKRLVMRITRADGSEQFVRIAANRQLLTPDQIIPMNLKSLVIGSKGSEAGAQTKILDKPQNGTYFTDTFPRATPTGVRSTVVMSEQEFKSFIKDDDEALEKAYEALIEASMEAEVSPDKVLLENEEIGESLGDSIVPAASTTSPASVAANGSGGGGNQPPIGGANSVESDDDDGMNSSEPWSPLNDWTLEENLNENEINTLANNEELVESIVEAPPGTQAEFESRIGSLNKGIAWPLREGHFLLLGKPGTKGFNIFRVHRIDPVLGIQFTDGLGTLEPTGGEYYSYSDLFSNLFAKRWVTAAMSDAGLSSPEDLLNFMQEKSGIDAWKDIEMRASGDQKFLDFRDREFDSTQVPKKYFIAPDGKILEIHAIEGDQIIARLGKDFKQSTKADEANTASWYEEPRVYSVQFITSYLIRTGAVPWNKPDREINSRAVEDETKPGTLRAIMGKLSFHDIMAGGKKFFEEFKHHLEHGNHLQEQRVMLSMAKNLGMKWWNVEWYYDFKTKYENEEKKLIEDRIEVLWKMATPDRQKSIRNSLLTDGTHDYDHWTNAIAMLQKHGNLYAWELQDLEWSWIFFKRIANIPLKGNVADYKEFQETVAKIKRKGIDNITEEAVIEEYMKTDSHFPNSQVWKMVKKNLKGGMDEEMENGEKEAAGFLTLDQKLSYAMGKLRWREYAHGIGAFKEVVKSKGSNKKRQAFAFALAMSRIPERLPRETLKMLVDMFEQGQIHSPALNFVKERSDQSLFRGVIEDLVELKASTLDVDWAREIRDAYSKIKTTVKENTDTRKPESVLFDANALNAIEKFWNQYGEFLQWELTLKTDAENGFIRDTSKRSAKPRLQQYWSRISGHLGDANIMEEKQVDIGTPFMQGSDGASPLMVRPDKVFDKIGLANSMGRQESSTLYNALQEDFFLSLDEYRWVNTDENGSPTGASEEDQKEYFTLLFSAFAKKMETIDFTSWMRSPLGAEFASIGLEPPKKIGNTAYLRERSRITQLLNDVTNTLGPKEVELRTLLRSPTPANEARRALLNSEVNSERAKQAQYNRMLNELEQASKNQVGRMNLADPDQKAHFEECFNRFYTKHSVSTTQSQTQGGASRILDTSEARLWSVAPSNIPLSNTDNRND
jgi:hypothetical protein